MYRINGALQKTRSAIHMISEMKAQDPEMFRVRNNAHTIHMRAGSTLSCKRGVENLGVLNAKLMQST